MLRLQTLHGGAFACEIERYRRWVGIVCCIAQGKPIGWLTCQPSRQKHDAIATALNQRPSLPVAGQPHTVKIASLAMDPSHSNGVSAATYRGLLCFEPGRIFMGFEAHCQAFETAILAPECPTCRAKPGESCAGFGDTGGVNVTHGARSALIKGEQTRFSARTIGPSRDYGSIMQAMYSTTGQRLGIRPQISAAS